MKLLPITENTFWITWLTARFDRLETPRLVIESALRDVSSPK
jgi:hypothetical protein